MIDSKGNESMQERKICGKQKSTRPAEALGLRVEIPKNEDLHNLNNRTPIRRSYSSASLPDCYDCTGHQLQESFKNHSLVSYPRHSPREISPKQVYGLSGSPSPTPTNSDGYNDGYSNYGEAVDTFETTRTIPLVNAAILPRSFLFRGCLKSPMNAEDREQGDSHDFVVVKQGNQNKKTIDSGVDGLRASSDFSHVGLSLSSPNPSDPTEPNEASDNNERL